MIENKIPWVTEQEKLINGVRYLVEINACLGDGVYFEVLEWNDDFFHNHLFEPLGRVWNRALPLSFLEEN
jgi:hypothetical protein